MGRIAGTAPKRGRRVAVSKATGIAEGGIPARQKKPKIDAKRRPLPDARTVIVPPVAANDELAAVNAGSMPDITSEHFDIASFGRIEIELDRGDSRTRQDVFENLLSDGAIDLGIPPATVAAVLEISRRALLVADNTSIRKKMGRPTTARQTYDELRTFDFANVAPDDTEGIRTAMRFVAAYRSLKNAGEDVSTLLDTQNVKTASAKIQANQRLKKRQKAEMADRSPS